MALALALMWAIGGASLTVAQSPASPTAGNPEPALLVGGNFGDGRLIPLDTHGAPVGYGAGEGAVIDASLCPGGSLLVEAVVDLGLGATLPPRVAVRDLATLKVVEEVDLTTILPSDSGIGDVVCGDETASAISVFLPFAGIVQVRPEQRVIAEGNWRRALLTPSQALVVPEKGANEVRLVSLADGSEELLYEQPSGQDIYWDTHSMTPSPSGDRVAIADWISGGPSAHTIRVFDLVDGSLAMEKSFPEHQGTTTAWWIDDSSLAVTFLGYSDGDQDPIWGTVILLDAATGEEKGRWQGLSIYPHLIADHLIIGSPVSGIPGTLAAVSAFGSDPLVVGRFEPESVQGVHGMVPVPVTALAALPAFEGEALVTSIADDTLAEAESGTREVLVAGVVLGAGVLVAGLGFRAWRRRAGTGEAPVMDSPSEAVEVITGQTGDPIAEWALWLVGITGSLVWALGMVLIVSFSSGSNAADSEPAINLAVALLLMPAAPYLIAIVGALGLGRGSRWSIGVGRLSAALLIASLPLAIAGYLADIEPGIVRFVAGLPIVEPELVMPSLALVPQVVLGVAALWELRSPRSVTFPAASTARPPASIARAGWIVVAIGVGPALVITLGIVNAAGSGSDIEAASDAIPLGIAAVTMAALGIGVGRGVLGMRRWSVPALVPTCIFLSLVAAVITVVVLSPAIVSVVSDLAGYEASGIANLLTFLGGVVVALAGAYALVVVLRARAEFVFR